MANASCGPNRVGTPHQAAIFLADAFFAAGFFFATCALTVASGDSTPLLSTRNAPRFFAPAIHPGARPNPDQVLPVFGSAYFAAHLLARFVAAAFLPTMAFLTANAFFGLPGHRWNAVSVALSPQASQKLDAPKCTASPFLRIRVNS